MRQDQYTIIDNRRVSPDTFVLTLSGNTTAFRTPGQFVNVSVPGYFLRRPFSVMTWNSEEFRIMYKNAGHGTEAMTGLKQGDSLDVLTGLGNGFDMNAAGSHPLLVAGGSGVSPMYCLAEHLVQKGILPTVIMGFVNADHVVMADELQSMGCNVIITTEDGSRGIPGLVTDALEIPEKYSFVYCCGPVPMMKAVSEKITADGQFSFEARMGCGFGACMGCSIMTNKGTKRVCKDGPVFGMEDLVW